MFFVSRNVYSMLVSDYMHLSLRCTDECLNLDHDAPDAMDEMALSIYTMIARGNEVNKDTIENFVINFEMICRRILDKTDVGREGFFVKMLQDLKNENQGCR